MEHDGVDKKNEIDLDEWPQTEDGQNIVSEVRVLYL